MIVPMKKVFIITQAKDADEAARALRSLGVVHVENQQPPKGADIASLQEDLDLIGRAITILSAPGLKALERFTRIRLLRDWKFAARYITDLRSRLDQLEEFSRNLSIRISQWEMWGDFEPAAINSLREKGIRVKLYLVPASDFGKLPQDVVVREIFRAGGTVGCAIISRKDDDIPFKEIPLPAMGLKAMKARLEKDSAVIKKLKADLAKCARYRGRFFRIQKAFEKELELHEAAHGMAQSGTLSYLAGYVPFDQVHAVADAARREKWAIVTKDPAEEDEVPTLMRNPRWISIIEPVFKFLEVIPGYRELDISPLFLLFLSLFFGMIIGDAGYGALYIALTAFFQKRLGDKAKDKRVFFLLYLFSASAVMWGILTGTVFGQEWYIAAGFRPLIPILNDTKVLQALCFFIGAFHLTLGHCWQAIRKLPSITALADMGWILVLWAAFFLARMLILGYALPSVTKWLIIAGVALVVFCSSPQRNILKAVASGLGTVALSIMNNFTDVVSYIRLFAVGLAGVAISDTVNSLAASVGEGAPLAKPFILLAGHTLNIVLGPVSVLVHGIRLNVLEFSSHVGLSWSGRPYRPLKKEAVS